MQLTKDCQKIAVIRYKTTSRYMFSYLLFFCLEFSSHSREFFTHMDTSQLQILTYAMLAIEQ